MVKVALVQRICPPYRLAVFRNLAKKIGLTVYYGKGLSRGSYQNAKVISGFCARKLFTLGFRVKIGERDYYLSCFPYILWYLYKDRPQVIITEGTTNIINNLFLIPYCRLRGIKIIWWDGGRDIRIPARGMRKLLDFLVGFLVKRANACIAYGRIGRQYLASLGFPAEKIFIAQNTIDISDIEKDIEKYNEGALEKARRKYNLGQKRVILYAGAIEPRRKIEDLLMAFEEVKTKLNVALLLIGDGYHREDIQRFIDRRKINDVHMLGRIVKGAGLYFLLSDILVLPGWSSLAINQAMAYGKPVITVAYGGPEYELVEDGKTGFIAERGNVPQLSSLIWKVLSNEKLSRGMGREGRSKIIREVSVDNMIDGIVKAIEFRQGI